MSNQAVKPEDILPDGVDSAEVNGVKVRKGTVGAVLANADILQSADAPVEQKQNALSVIHELAPSIARLGLHKHISWKNPEIQAIMDAEVQKLDA